jgi:hypothetical protein
MKRLVILAIFFAFSLVGYSQQQPQNLLQPRNANLASKVVVGDIAFFGQTLKTVEIKGSEVIAYLEVEKESPNS